MITRLLISCVRLWSKRIPIFSLALMIHAQASFALRPLHLTHPHVSPSIAIARLDQRQNSSVGSRLSNPFNGVRVETIELSIGTSASTETPQRLSDNTVAASSKLADDQPKLVFTPLCMLNFGAAVSGANGGTIAISNGGHVQFNGSVIGVLTSTSPTGAIVDLAICNTTSVASQTPIILPDASGQDLSLSHQLEFIANGRHYTIIAPMDATITDKALHQSMLVDQFTLSTSRGKLFIGATLHAGPNQPSGEYTGHFVLTVVSEPIQ